MISKGRIKTFRDHFVFYRYPDFKSYKEGMVYKAPEFWGTFLQLQVWLIGA